MFRGTDPQDGPAAGGSPPKLTPIEAAALDYLRAGFVPIPIARGRKKPPCFTWSTIYGYDRASGTLKQPPTEDDVRAWATKYPGYNVALLTGRAGGFDVIDPDMKPGQNGMGALAELEEAALGMLPDGPTQVTPNGGRHFLYRPATRSFPIGGKVTQLADDVDTRLDGNYIVVAPSGLLEEQGEDGRWVKLPEPRSWMWDPAHPPLRQDTLPELPQPWQERLLALKDGGKNGEPAPSPEVGGAIPLHQRNSTLTSQAGTMRRRGMPEAAIFAALQIVNAEQCVPPLPESEVRAIAHSVGRYAPASPPGPEPSVWKKAVDVVDFLAAKDPGVVWIKPNIAARGVMTEFYSPRGIGKTNITYGIAKECVDAGFRVLLLDRDNHPIEIRRRMRCWGLATILKDRFRVMTRDEVPRLTDAAAWASFPIEAYDLVIVDALDSVAEGVGEQDSKQPSKAIAVLLDISRRENGPGVITLGNTVRTGAHSRGSGVMEDRGDIVYELRDATGLKPTGEKDWWLELPKASADAWGERSSRRRGQNVFRLAFVQSKFRVGKEPDPFVLDMDLSGETWSYRDATAELLATVGQTIEAQQRSKQRKKEEAVLALQTAIRQAVADGKPLKMGDAEKFLMASPHKLAQAEARAMLSKGDKTSWQIEKGPGKGSPLCLFPLEVDMVNEEEEERENPPVKMDSSDSSSFFVAPKQGDVPATKKEKGARGRLCGTAKVVPIRVPDAPSAAPAPVVLDPDDPLNDREPDQPPARAALEGRSTLDGGRL